MKKIIYLSASTILGLLLSILTHFFIEIQYLKSIDSIKVVWHGGCALPFWLQIFLPLIFGISFFFIGKVWWRFVYVEKRHWRFNK